MSDLGEKLNKMSVDQWLFLQNTLDEIKKRTTEISAEHGPTQCGTCVKCCNWQTPTVSLMDCYWAVQAIRREGPIYWNHMKKQLMDYLSKPVHQTHGIYRACPFLGNKGCTIHGNHPMVCRAFNFTRPGVRNWSGQEYCGPRVRPGIKNQSTEDLVEFYFEARKQFEKIFPVKKEGHSMMILPAGVFWLMSDDGEVEKLCSLGLLDPNNFNMRIRNDIEEIKKYI